MNTEELISAVECIMALDPIKNGNVFCFSCGNHSDEDCMCSCHRCETYLTSPEEECPTCVPRCGICTARLCEASGYMDQGSQEPDDWTRQDGELCVSCFRGPRYVIAPRLRQRPRVGDSA